MKKHEISKVLSGIVLEAIAEGYSIAFGELRGSYSDCEGQTVLAKGRDRLIVWASASRDFRSESITVYAAKVRLGTVGEGAYSRPQSLDYDFHWSDDWKKGLMFQKTFYRVGSREDDWYVESESEAQAAAQKHHDRCKARRVTTSRELEVTPSLLKVVRKLKGFKTVKAENVSVRKNYNDWTHEYEYVIRNTKSGNTVRLG